MKKYHLSILLNIAMAGFLLTSCSTKKPKAPEPKPKKENIKTKIMKDAEKKVEKIEEDFVPDHIKNSTIQSVIY